jgi:hypothetical protein
MLAALAPIETESETFLSPWEISFSHATLHIDRFVWISPINKYIVSTHLFGALCYEPEGRSSSPG